MHIQDLSLNRANDMGNNASSSLHFEAALSSSLVPNRGILNSFTRGDADATVTDFEGLVKNVQADEARFVGARRVENLVPYALSDIANWSTTGTWTETPAPDGQNTGIKNTFTTIGLAVDLFYRIPNVTISESEISNQIKFKIVNLPDDAVVKLYSGASSVGVGNIGDLTTEKNVWHRASVSQGEVVLTSGTAGITINTGATTGEEIEVHFADIQYEDVTGQDNQNPSEFVSVGVLSSPYHGANVDAVKYFEYENGNTVSSNIVAEATGDSIIADGTLIEEASTNIFTYSDDLTHANWNISSVTVGTNSVVCVDGITRATNTLTAIGANQSLGQFITSANQTMSCYMKRKTGTGIIKLEAIGGPTETDVTSLINSTTWTRVSHSHTSSQASISWVITIGTSGDEIEVCGMQLEDKPFATSYIPTIAATVTRDLEELQYEMLPEIYSNTVNNLTIYCEFELSHIPTSDIFLFGLYNVTGTRSFGIKIDSSGDIVGFKQPVLLQVTPATAAAVNTKYKAAVRFSDTTGIDISINGGALLNNTNTVDVDLSGVPNEILAGTFSGGINHLNSVVKNCKVYNKVLSDTKMQAMTS